MAARRPVRREGCGHRTPGWSRLGADVGARLPPLGGPQAREAQARRGPASGGCGEPPQGAPPLRGGGWRRGLLRDRRSGRRRFFDHLGRRHGPEGFTRSVTNLRRTFPDLRVSVEEQSAQGDTVTTRCALRGVDRGGVLWYPPTNKRAASAAVYTDRFSGGMLVEHRGESDTADLLEQLGLPPRGA